MDHAKLQYFFFTAPSPWLKSVQTLRLEVFVHELNVPVELELDAFDAVAHHLILQKEAVTIGTLRIIIKNHTIAKIGRVAITPRLRHQGLGQWIMQAAISYCKNLGIHHICLNSQAYITEFYKKLGFSCEGEVFMDAGIVHQHMVLTNQPENEHSDEL